MKWLLIGAHCDDVELGIGGYLARAIRTKEVKPEDVMVLVLSAGDTAMRHGGTVDKLTRIEEAEAAMALLGVYNVAFCGFRENYMDQEPLSDMMNAISDAVDDFKPDEIYGPMPGFNQDHRQTHDALIAALRPTKPMVAKRVWLYEYPGDSFAGLTQTPLPTWGWCYITLTEDDMAKKEALCSAHVSQMKRPQRSHVSVAGVRKLAELRGSECCHSYAERVLLLREVYE